MSQLVLSLFPGIGLLDTAFELEGFCVVRGPDLLWGGDIRKFHPPAGKFDGVIGGPPCQAFTELVFLVRANGHEPKYGNLIPEFERAVWEARPQWFLMENVSSAPQPSIPGYTTFAQKFNNRWFGAEQNRERLFTFGYENWLEAFKLGSPWRYVEVAALEAVDWSPAVTGDMRIATNGKRIRTKPGGGVCPHVGRLASFTEMLRLQGLPSDFLNEAPFTQRGKRQAIGNGVPLPMGRAVARAVKKAIGMDRAED